LLVINDSIVKEKCIVPKGTPSEKRGEGIPTF